MIETYVASVVGVDGPTLQVQSDDEDFNQFAEAVWRRWWELPDINAQLSGVELLRQWVRSLWCCGEFLEVLTQDRESDWVTLRIQDIHPRRLKTPVGLGMNRMLRDGVERSDTGKPLAYHIESFAAGEMLATTTGELTRYTADQIIHGFKQREPGQVRGIPWLAPVLQTCADIRCYDEQVMDAARSAADMSVLLYTDHPDATYVAVNEQTVVERRTIRTLPPGWKAAQMQAAQPTAQYADYRSERLREIGRPVNMPLMMVRLDSSNHNYSSARFDGQMFSRETATCQRWLGRIALNRICRLVIREASLIEGVAVPESFDLRWTWATMPHVDPGKEASAAETALANNTTTLADVCATSGKDWEQVLAQRKREKKLMETLGLLPETPVVPEAAPLSPAQQRHIRELVEAIIEQEVRA
jgi:lambda family phage portal protein